MNLHGKKNSKDTHFDILKNMECFLFEKKTPLLVKLVPSAKDQQKK